MKKSCVHNKCEQKNINICFSFGFVAEYVDAINEVDTVPNRVHRNRNYE